MADYLTNQPKRGNAGLLVGAILCAAVVLFLVISADDTAEVSGATEPAADTTIVPLE
jgi:hypothetical protein